LFWLLFWLFFLVVKYAPQLELIKKASLVITHAGMNTTLESLSNGVAMVGIPVTADQPGIAARIAWSGVGEFVPLSRLSVLKLKETVKQVWKEESYRKNAVRLQNAISSAGGVRRAADIIEISTKSPLNAISR
jgi:zeaxanthin glucosyltransferase